MTYQKKKIPILDPAEGYDKYVAQYRKDYAWLNSFEQGYIAKLRSNISGKKVLDAGCGTGRNSIRLSEMGAQVTAVDISPNMVKSLQYKNNITTHIADISDLPIEDNTFDIVICNLVLVHFYDPSQALTELYRVLKPDGLIWLTILHQRKPPLLISNKEKFKIESFYHNATKIREILEKLAFNIKEETPIIENETTISTLFWCNK